MVVVVAVLDATNKERPVGNDPVSACLDSAKVDLPGETVQDIMVCADRSVLQYAEDTKSSNVCQSECYG